MDGLVSDEAAHVLDLAAGTATDAGGEYERAQCLGHLALVEALRGPLRRAAKLAAEATAARTDGRQRSPAQHPNPAVLVALARVHLQHDELRETHRRLKQVDAALAVSPDQLTGAVACLAAAYAAQADGRALAAVQIIARARSGVPPRLARAEVEPGRIAGRHDRAGNIAAALAAAQRSGDHSQRRRLRPHTRVGMAAGNRNNTRRALVPVLATENQAPERVRLQAWLVDAQLSYGSGDPARGH